MIHYWHFPYNTGPEYELPWKSSLVWGIGWIVLGLTVFAFPQILVALVSAVLISIGITVTAAALGLRKINRAFKIRSSGIFDHF